MIYLVMSAHSALIESTSIQGRINNSGKPTNREPWNSSILTECNNAVAVSVNTTSTKTKAIRSLREALAKPLEGDEDGMFLRFMEEGCMRPRGYFGQSNLKYQ